MLNDDHALNGAKKKTKAVMKTLSFVALRQKMIPAKKRRKDKNLNKKENIQSKCHALKQIKSNYVLRDDKRKKIIKN